MEILKEFELKAEDGEKEIHLFGNRFQRKTMRYWCDLDHEKGVKVVEYPYSNPIFPPPEVKNFEGYTFEEWKKKIWRNMDERLNDLYRYVASDTYIISPRVRVEVFTLYQKGTDWTNPKHIVTTAVLLNVSHLVTRSDQMPFP